jgi:DNA-binding NarL/FixJ family response regulator
MNPIKLLIVDDHTILRQGLIGILEEYPDLCIVAEAENGQNMINKYFTFHPDVVLSDIEMPEVNGLEAAQEILKRDPNAKILFLSMHDSDENIYKLLQIKAYGLVPKEVIKNELVLAIRTVAKGKKYFQGRSEEDLEKIRLKYSTKQKVSTKTIEDILTPAEKKILMQIADGKTSQEIANLSNRSKRTVDATRVSIMYKLRVHSLPQLIKYAIDYSVSIKQK